MITVEIPFVCHACGFEMIGFQVPAFAPQPGTRVHAPCPKCRGEWLWVQGEPVAKTPAFGSKLKQPEGLNPSPLELHSPQGKGSQLL